MANVKIYGTGEIPGGVYEDVSVYGSAKSTSDITAVMLTNCGAFKTNGSIKTGDFNSSGSCKIAGNLDARIISSMGALKIEGSCNATKAKIRGSITINGDFNTDTLDAKLEQGKFKNIYGDNIIIKKNEWLGVNVEIDEIEATVINVQDIKAKRLSGTNVYVYGNSHIDVVEYTGELTISKTSFVKEIIKL